MQRKRITATLGAIALGGVLVASTTSVGASASVDRQRPAHAKVTVHDHFVPPKLHKFRPHSDLRMGLHCESSDMAI